MTEHKKISPIVSASSGQNDVLLDIRDLTVEFWHQASDQPLEPDHPKGRGSGLSRGGRGRENNHGLSNSTASSTQSG